MKIIFVNVVNENFTGKTLITQDGNWKSWVTLFIFIVTVSNIIGITWGGQAETFSNSFKKIVLKPSLVRVPQNKFRVSNTMS